MLNKAMVQGRIVDDVYMNQISDGIRMASFTIACERDYKSKETGKRDVDFIDVVAKGQAADYIERNFKKGDVVIACGRLKRREYVDKNGNERSSLKIACENVYFG